MYKKCKKKKKKKSKSVHVHSFQVDFLNGYDFIIIKQKKRKQTSLKYF